MEAEIADMQKDIDRQKQQAVAAMERLETNERDGHNRPTENWKRQSMSERNLAGQAAFLRRSNKRLASV